MTDIHVISGAARGMESKIVELVSENGSVLLADLAEDTLKETKSDLESNGTTDVHYETVETWGNA